MAAHADLQLLALPFPTRPPSDLDLGLRAGMARDGSFDRAEFCRRVERAEPDTKTAGTHITLLLRRSNAERPGGDGALGLHPGKDATLGLSCSRLLRRPVVDRHILAAFAAECSDGPGLEIGREAGRGEVGQYG